MVDPCDGTDVVPAVTRPTDVEAVGDELVAVLPVPHDNRVLAGVDQDVQRVLKLILSQAFERISYIFGHSFPMQVPRRSKQKGGKKQELIKVVNSDLIQTFIS